MVQPPASKRAATEEQMKALAERTKKAEEKLIAEKKAERSREKSRQVHIFRRAPVDSSSDRSSGSASMAALARQGLAGGDTMALDRVLHTTNNAVMAATARDITGPEAAQILSHICMALDKSPARAVVLSEWTRNLLLVHAGYLSGHPEDTRAVIGTRTAPRCARDDRSLRFSRQRPSWRPSTSVRPTFLPYRSCMGECKL
ncbi:hypothetical protein FOZ61_001069 [Perkinsus olseni]|uniref:Uncharacterized protein n=1 Tax=Perkinsus olseni TaxID=32597 RepID=A0A7J6LXW6_PEROL|nr:hypothetical protein FOZ61_001069 [Perkinsus olseni]